MTYDSGFSFRDKPVLYKGVLIVERNMMNRRRTGGEEGVCGLIHPQSEKNKSPGNIKKQSKQAKQLNKLSR